MQVEGEETKLSCPSGCPLVPSRAPIWGAGHMPWGFHGPGDLENVGTTVKVKSSRHLQWHLSITVETKQRHCVCSVGVKRRLRFTAFCSLHDRLPWLRHITTSQNGCPASQVVVCRRSCSFGPYAQAFTVHGMNTAIAPLPHCLCRHFQLDRQFLAVGWDWIRSS